jgi:lipoprotein-anchoring transpeptidase ErfK/SrfK
MIARSPYLPRFTAGGEGNPLGARAMYLSGSVYRIHGTNAPWTIGSRATSGCIRMVNEDVIDLYNRVKVGTKVVVLPMAGQRAAPGMNAAPPAERRAATGFFGAVY